MRQYTHTVSISIFLYQNLYIVEIIPHKAGEFQIFSLYLQSALILLIIIYYINLN